MRWKLNELMTKIDSKVKRCAAMKYKYEYLKRTGYDNESQMLFSIEDLVQLPSFFMSAGFAFRLLRCELFTS